MDYDKLCTAIREFDPKVRFVGVCNETGESNMVDYERA